MQFIEEKQNPKYSFPQSLDQIIEQDNEVRTHIDLFY